MTKSISIIIPVYNGVQTIERCLDSVLGQLGASDEIIVVNDGSTDQTEEVLGKYSNRVKIITQVNQGAPVARNRGASEARGDYLLFCDADVVLMPEALERWRSTLDSRPEAYAYSSFRFNGKLFSSWPFDETRLRRMPYIHTTALIRRECFPGFDPSLKRFQDWDLWLTLLDRGQRGVWIDQVLFAVVGQGTMSSWLPSWAYRLLPWLPTVQKYNQAKAIIYQKHNL